MEFTPYTLLTDVGWISVLLIVGNILRNRLKLLQALLLPAPITAGLLGLLLGDEVLGVIHWSDQVGTYTTAHRGRVRVHGVLHGPRWFRCLRRAQHVGLLLSLIHI